MSRVVAHTDNFPCIGCDETNFNLASTTWSSNFTSTNYKYDNLKTVASSTTYARVNVKKDASADSYLYLLFDFSSIPAGATIGQLSGKVRVYRTGSSTYCSASQARWCKGDKNTGYKTSQNFSTSSNPTALETNPIVSSLPRADLDDIKCYVHYTRTNRTSNTQYYIYIYGADVTVNWEETLYEVNVSSNSQSVTISASENETTGGGTNIIMLTNVSSLDAIQLTDNGNDVTSSLVASGSNYIYTLSNVSDDHTIVVSDVQQQTSSLYRKTNSWSQYTKVYKKTNNSWVQQTISLDLFDGNKIIVSG